MRVGDYILLTFCIMILRPKQLVDLAVECILLSQDTVCNNSLLSFQYRNPGDILDILLEGSPKLKRLFFNA
jgi:hypothetical protein